jgi:hypothetical protein
LVERDGFLWVAGPEERLFSGVISGSRPFHIAELNKRTFCEFGSRALIVFCVLLYFFRSNVQAETKDKAIFIFREIG